MKTNIIAVVLLLPVFLSFSQTKVQKLYDAEKYEKCLMLCEKNIKSNIDKQEAILYKSLTLLNAFESEKIAERYPFPVYEALKGVKKLETYRKQKPKDKFYIQNRRKIKYITEESLLFADSFYIKGDIKRAVKIYKKLKGIYPEKKLYVFKLAKVYDFNVQKIRYKFPEFSEAELYKTIYEVVSKSSTYLQKSGKYELENALEKIYRQEDCDMEMASIFLVFLKQNYKSSTKAKMLSAKFQEKYLPIDMLVRVNEKRASGYTCGNKKIGKKPPLILDNCLIRTAQKYAELMDEKNHFSHTGPDGKSPWVRARNEGCSADGENIAGGSSSVSGALNQWMHSPGHCKNIMGSHTHMGVGESGSYWVQMFR